MNMRGYTRRWWQGNKRLIERAVPYKSLRYNPGTCGGWTAARDLGGETTEW